MVVGHFTAALLFALCTSVVFAVTGKDNTRDRLHYGAWVFGLFLGISLLAAWLMVLVHR